MGSEPEYEPSSIPKLSLFRLPSKPRGPPAMLTPPHHTLASIPFRWEEAPGKPRPTTTTTNTARYLDLPPRLLPDKFTNMPSPTTVLNGPYMGRSLSHTTSFSSPRSTEEWMLGGGRYRKKNSKERCKFYSCNWGSYKEINRGTSGGSFDFSSYSVGGGFENDSKVKLTRVRRGSSLLSFSNASSSLLASIYESFKQAVPWRRIQVKLRKMDS